MEDMKKSTKQSKVVLPILLSALMVLIVCGGVLFFVKTQNIEQVGVDKAKALADQITLLRTFYTKEVVSRAKRNKIRVNYDWNEDEVTLPLPATFTNEVGERIAKANPGTSIRLYSRYPFPHRKPTETYDQFELDALEQLERDPQSPFYRFETISNRLSVRYAIADVMRPACVGCHNNHPETPKTG
ncbi:MAG: DUF3365 domain-containing protein [Nitrospirales bacterium]|nr:DUF3365 domain-containing protein [Nitrospirales bacterium]